MTLNEKFEKAMDLLERVEANEIPPPDDNWYGDYYELTGIHMILTDEGWVSGDSKQSLIDEYGEDAILDEVNIPVLGKQ
jgi:hypothetical protein